MSVTGTANPNLLRLAYDYVAGFSIDQPSALESLRGALTEMSCDEIRQWLTHMEELMADDDIAADTLFALLGLLDGGERWICAACWQSLLSPLPPAHLAASRSDA